VAGGEDVVRKALAAAVISAVLLALVPAVGASPRCALEGSVVDSTGLPVPGATVRLYAKGADEPCAEAVVDAEGAYCFAGAEPGPYTVEVSLPGFTPASTSAVLGDGPVRRDLRVIPAMAEDIVVTATRTGRLLEDVPVRTELIDREALEVLAPRTLAEAVEYTTGVRVENNCQNCNFSQVRLLGLEGPYTRILIDSLPLMSSLAQVYGIEQIPGRLLDRVEVVKGGGSALYGPGSVGGVVNVIPREARSNGGSFEMAWEPNENDAHGSGGFDLASGDTRTGLTGFAQIDRINARDVNGDGFSDIACRDMEATGLRLHHQTRDGNGRLTADWNRAHEDRRGGDRLDLPPDQAEIAEAIDSVTQLGSLAWRHALSSRFDYRVGGSVSFTDRDTYYGAGRDPNAYGISTSRLFVLDAQANHYLGGHVISWGAQHTTESLQDEQAAYARFIDEAYRNTGLFLQDGWSFARGFELIAGARVDWHSELSGAEISPRFAFMWSPTEDIDVRASAARGFRAPAVFDEDLHILAAGGEAVVICPGENLRPETSVNWMGGLEWRPDVGRGQGLLEANAFYTPLNDLFYTAEADDPATPQRELEKVNLGTAEVYGMEFNLGWGIGSRIVIQGGMVLQRAHFGEAEPDFGSTRFYRTPERYGKLTLTWQAPKDAEVFFGIRYTGTMLVPHYAGSVEEDRLEETDPFLTFDVHLGRTFTLKNGRSLRVRLLARNITNDFQPDLDLGPDRDSGYVYGPRFPRRIALNVGFTF
jgi:outer membrane receptor for ferrienterochelin and colicins